MKRKLLIALVLVIGIAAALLYRNDRAYRRASYQGKHVREWATELYANFDPRGTNAAALAFLAMGSNAVPALCALVEQREPFYEKTFLKHARQIPLKPRNYLFQKLQPGRTVEYRIGAVRALGVIGPAALEALPVLAEALADRDSRVRWTAAQTITLLGPEAIAALIPLTTNADVNLRHAAVYSLGEARTNALPATIALIRCTTDTNESVRGSAYYSLSRIGRPAVPTVVEMAATDPNPELRNAAFRSLIVLTPPSGRVLGSHLQISTNSAEMRGLAVLALSRTRLTNAHAMTLISNSLADPDETVRAAAELALRRITTGKPR